MLSLLLTIFIPFIFRLKFYRLAITMTIPKSPITSISFKLTPNHNSFTMFLVIKIPSLIIGSISPIELSSLIIHHIIFPFPFVDFTVWPDISPFSFHFSIFEFPRVFFIKDLPIISLHYKNGVINKGVLLF